MWFGDDMQISLGCLWRALQNFLLSAVLCLVLVAAPKHVRAAETVSTAEELLEILQSAAPGTDITLAPGNYGTLTLTNLKGTAQAPIRISSADPETPASISALDLRESEHIVFENLLFDYQYNAFDPPNLRVFEIFTSRNITFRHNLFDGDIAPSDDTGQGYPTAFGLSVRASTQITLDQNEIRDFYRGLIFFDVVDIKITNNDVHSIRSDGMNFAQVENLLIEDNTIRDFKRLVTSGDHADMIQFWTASTTRPSRNIIIRGNVLNSGTGAFTQSIFMRNELVDRGQAGRDFDYSNVTIEENVIINAHLHGITVGQANGLNIKHNTLIHNRISDGDTENVTRWIPQVRVASDARNVTISGNLASKIDGYKDQDDWMVDDNQVIQDQFPVQPGFYDTVFLAARTGAPNDLENFRYLQKRSANAPGAALLERKKAKPSLFHPVISTKQPKTGQSGITLSAERTVLPSPFTSAEAKFTWRSRDQVIGSGPEIVFATDTAGQHEVILEAALPDGRLQSTAVAIQVQNGRILEFDHRTSEFLSFGRGRPKPVPDLPLTDGGVPFGGGNTAWEIPAGLMADFFDATEFRLDLRMYLPADYDASGELMRIHPSFIVNLTPRGTLDLLFETQDFKVKQVTAPLPLRDGRTVDLSFDYSNSRGSLEVFANGKMISRARITGRTPTRKFWGLGFGAHLNNRQGALGVLEALSLSAKGASLLDVQNIGALSEK